MAMRNKGNIFPIVNAFRLNRRRVADFLKAVRIASINRDLPDDKHMITDTPDLRFR